MAYRRQQGRKGDSVADVFGSKTYEHPQRSPARHPTASTGEMPRSFNPADYVPPQSRRGRNPHVLDLERAKIEDIGFFGLGFGQGGETHARKKTASSSTAEQDLSWWEGGGEQPSPPKKEQPPPASPPSESSFFFGGGTSPTRQQQRRSRQEEDAESVPSSVSELMGGSIASSRESSKSDFRRPPSLWRSEEVRRKQLDELDRQRGGPKFDQYAKDELRPSTGKISQTPRGHMAPGKEGITPDKIKYKFTAPKNANQGTFNPLTGEEYVKKPVRPRDDVSITNSAPFALDAEVDETEHYRKRMQQQRLLELVRQQRQLEELQEQLTHQVPDGSPRSTRFAAALAAVDPRGELVALQGKEEEEEEVVDIAEEAAAEPRQLLPPRQAPRVVQGLPHPSEWEKNRPAMKGSETSSVVEERRKRRNRMMSSTFNPFTGEPI